MHMLQDTTWKSIHRWQNQRHFHNDSKKLIHFNNCNIIFVIKKTTTSIMMCTYLSTFERSILCFILLQLNGPQPYNCYYGYWFSVPYHKQSSKASLYSDFMYHTLLWNLDYTDLEHSHSIRWNLWWIDVVINISSSDSLSCSFSSRDGCLIGGSFTGLWSFGEVTSFIVKQEVCVSAHWINIGTVPDHN